MKTGACGFLRNPQGPGYGVSNVYLFTTSHSLFLTVFDAQDLAYTYIGGSFAVLLVGGIYNRLQHKISPTRLVVGTLLFLLVTLLGARAWLFLGQSRGPAAFLAVCAPAGKAERDGAYRVGQRRKTDPPRRGRRGWSGFKPLRRFRCVS